MRKLTDKVSILCRMIRETVASEECRISSWVLTDVGEPASIVVADTPGTGGNQTLQVTLDPYYYFWKPSDESERKLQAQADQILAGAVDRLMMGNKMEDDDIVHALQGLRETYEPDIITLENATDEIRKREQALNDINPAVREAVVNTARLASIFRSIRRSNHAEWLSFRQSLTRIDRLLVGTPNEFAKFGPASNR